MVRSTNLAMQTLLDLSLAICYKPYIIILHIHIKGTSSLQNLLRSWK